jgi:hypothetical protein
MVLTQAQEQFYVSDFCSVVTLFWDLKIDIKTRSPGSKRIFHFKSCKKIIIIIIIIIDKGKR